ncbi:MDR family MFS transporter [Hazenella coriacea]|uniref:Putative MFS family arabinose efflux permease n=1 Tax=Hazenella coriacea TaxID=1179467 RepID=A0A4R3L2L5_9BACL|nr:MFS transporter [Hazenella coriacea]TCS92541.1 putative MFS family arabinose efflux permease [Hazenella coriacea]
MIKKWKQMPTVMWILAVCFMVNTLGESLLWPLQMTYIHQQFGQSLTVGGFVLFFHFAIAFIGNLIGGYLYDRWGAKRIFTLSISFSFLIVILMMSAKEFYLYATLLLLLGFSKGMFLPLARSLPLQIWPEGGRDAVNVTYVMENLGVALGAACSGFLGEVSMNLVFAGNAFTYILVLVATPYLFRRLSQTITETENEIEESKSAVGKVVDSKRGMFQLVMLTSFFSILIISYVQWQTVVPTYLKSIDIPLTAYGLLWTVNGLLVVTGQPFVTWLIRVTRMKLHMQIFSGSLLFVITMLILSQATHYEWFVLGMVVMTFGEMLVWPAVPARVAEIAPKDKQGFYQGIAVSGHSVGRMIGPLLGGYLFEQLGNQVMFMSMAAICLLTSVLLWSYQLKSYKRQSHWGSEQAS